MCFNVVCTDQCIKATHHNFTISHITEQQLHNGRRRLSYVHYLQFLQTNMKLTLKGGALGVVSQIMLAGAIVLLFFVILSGVTNHTPLRQTYFLQADTSSLTGSGRAISQWTYFYVCGEGNTNCGSPVPALPLGYAWVGGTEGVPADLVGYV